MADLRASIQFVETSAHKANERMAKVCDETTELKKEVNFLKSELATHRKKMTSMEISQRKSNLKILGVPESGRTEDDSRQLDDIFLHR